MSKRARNRAAVNRERERRRREVCEKLGRLFSVSMCGPIEDRLHKYILPLPETKLEWQAQGFTFALDNGASARRELARLREEEQKARGP